MKLNHALCNDPLELLSEGVMNKRLVVSFGMQHIFWLFWIIVLFGDLWKIRVLLKPVLDGVGQYCIFHNWARLFKTNDVVS